MALIRATRDSIDDRFSVLGFNVRTEDPLFEVVLATDPDLLRSENRARRSNANFFSSRILSAGASSRGEAVYLVPPNIVARFVGQSRLYFGLATYRDSDRLHPVSVRIPDRGSMYVSLSGLTERGLRRTARADGATNTYGKSGVDVAWGGDTVASGSAPAVSGAPKASAAKKANGGATSPGATGEPAPYSDGYSDDLWKQREGAAPTSARSSAPMVPPAATPPAPAASAPATAQAYGVASAGGLGSGARRKSSAIAKPLLVSSYYQPTDWLDALRTQIGFFLQSAMWYLGVLDTTVMPHSAICQVRRPDGTDEGALHGSGFFIGPRLILTAAHVVDGQSELIIVPGKNGGGISSTTEPFGRFRASTLRKHPSYGSNHDFDMGLICVPEANASSNYFDLVEELTQSRPEGVVVTGYAARWYATDAMERFVNETIDPNKQHMMGGHIRSLPTDETFDYDLQTLGGTSGSPVYWLEDAATPRAHLVGVHVAAHSATTNLGCRITAAKLAWIRSVAAEFGQTVTFALGVPRSFGARALEERADDADAYGFSGPMPDDTPAAAAQGLSALTLDAPAPDYPCASRFVPAHAHNFSAGRKAGTAVDRIVIHTTDGAGRTDGTIGWFQNPDQRDQNNQPRRGSSHYIVGRDGEVVQMVRNADTAYHASRANWRSIGIEHETSQTLHVTEAEFIASAWLVAWLCAQYGLPVDRTSIVGHHEISPQDHHDDCPGQGWDWDHYMELVRGAAAALAGGTAIADGVRGALGAIAGAVGMSLGAPRADIVRAQEIITPFYDPSNPATALMCQDNAFSTALEEWFVGVEDTHAFPHSAICQLVMDGGVGTGFYIGRNRILTCMHNLEGSSQVTIVPGLNGHGNEPFGRCTVPASSWRPAPGYVSGGNGERDLAVIENVPLEAPNGAWFGFLQATPSDQMPLVVCGYSRKSDVVPALTALMDGDKQHLHGGYARSMSTTDLIEYPILTLHRASGSPVYHLDRSSGQLEAKVCAVHISGAPAAQGLNRGCFLTPEKLAWIEGRAATFALGQQFRPGQAGSANSDGITVRRKPSANVRAQGLSDLLPVNLKIRVFIPAPVAIVTIPGTDSEMPGQSAHGGDGRGFQRDGGTSRAEVTGIFHFGDSSGPTRLTDVTRTFGESSNYSREDTVVVAGKPGWYRNLRPGAKPIERGTQTVTDAKLNLELGGSSFHGILSMAENAVVVTFNIHASDPIVTGAPDIDATLALLIKMDGDRVKVRVNGGHDEFPAYEVYANGTLVYSYDPVVAGGTPWGLFGDGNWDVNPDTSYVDAGPATEYHIVGPVHIGGAQAQGLDVRALDVDDDSTHGIDGPIPDDVATAQSLAVARAMTGPGAEYPQASRFAAADSGNYRSISGTRTIERVVIHITDGGANINGTIGWFQNPSAKVSAHYVIGQDGEVVQMVRHNDVAWHARSANGNSIGIEHVANTRGLRPTPTQLAASAALVTWLCDQFGIAVDRTHVLGHSEADPGTAHAACPNAVWDWTYYMGLLTSRSSYAPAAQSLAAVRALEAQVSDYPVALIPQPDKNSCWAASMAMLLSWRHSASFAPETLAGEVGASLASSYSWDLLNAVRARYGFEMIRQPSSASLYHTPQQWSDWLGQYGALWVVIVGAPHAVVLAGIRGNLGDPASVQVKLLNPWDTRVSFDNDPVAFNPPNRGYQDWISFQQFASDFGNMAALDYGNWRVLYLPAPVAAAQSLGSANRPLTKVAAA